MGSSAVLRSKTYLEKTEIEKISSTNRNINLVFTREKNVDGLLTIKELNNITNGLINYKILKKIIQICGSKRGKLTYDDLCYFYALLTTSSFEAKINFLLDFIFIKNDKLKKEKYIKKINKYFTGSDFLTKIFLEEKLINNSSNLTREDIFSYIEKNYKKEIEDYSLYINKTKINYSNLNNSNEIENITTDRNDNNDDNTFIITNNKAKYNSNASLSSVNIAIVKNDQFESLSKEFKNIERKNNGVFPISVFEDMLREIDVEDGLIDIIGDYIKKKSCKSFFNFDLFKEVLSFLISEEKSQKKKTIEIIKGLFILISYPNKYIERKNLIKIFKKQNFEQKLDKLEIGEHIELKQFIELYYNKNVFTESLEHIQYLKYIFFREKIEDRSIEFDCFQILTKGKSMNEYILERLQYDNNFYLIDIEFWDKWSSLINEKENNEFTKLRINTKTFCDSHGKILEGKNYEDDYIIISETMNNLFLQWYGPPIGPIIVRQKIYLNDSGNNKTKGKKNSKLNFSGIERKTNKKFELELNPIFIMFLDFLYILRGSNNSLDEVKYKLRKLYKKKESDNNFIPFSRKTKFLEIAKKINNNIELNNMRFFVYFNDCFEENIEMNDTLEDLGMQDKAIILREEKVNNQWLSEKMIKKENNKSENENEENLVGLYNIGNTCFMNSILQIFLNIKQLKDIFIQENIEKTKSFLSFILNSENKEINKVVQKKGYLILELIELLKQKWINEKSTLNPSKFKEICGEYNPIFKTLDQQDAHDFYTFLVDKLHEETNIKFRSDNSYNDIQNSETIDTNDIDLGNECWANNIRKNASYFYALFMGQLKSTLICSECNTKKIKFEAFSSLEIPIPEEKNIIIEIILFRLPYSLRKFNLKKLNDDEDQQISFANIMENGEKSNNQNKNEKNDKYNLTTDENTITTEKKSEENEITNNLLNLNIPLRLIIEVNRKEKCSSIIDKLKLMPDLNIEKKYDFTEFIMISKGKYINEELKIDETFSNFNIVFVYELLNINGIINICNYKEKENIRILPLKSQEIQNKEKNKINKNTISKDNYKLNENLFSGNKFLNIPSFYFTIKENSKEKSKKKIEFEEYEILIPIIHRIQLDIIQTCFIPFYSYQYFYNYQDFIILSSSNSIKPFNLYEIMWKKYMYFLNCPSNYDNKTWWKSKKKDKKFLPFIIKIINKDTSSCNFCPWFRFCTGCTIQPNNSSYLTINSNSAIVIEWDREVYLQDINKNNISLVMNHSSFNKISDINMNNNQKISIYDCLHLFTKSEEINDIQCEKCKKKTLFKKTLEIERLPKYLVLVLKRFKYILTNSIKIRKLINFPLEDLFLHDFVSQKDINYKYNLFGVINHIGSLEGGHYNSIFKINDKYIEFDDSQVSENRGGIETNKAYMLIYKMEKPPKGDKNINFIELMNRAYRIYINRFKSQNLFNYVFDKNNNIIEEYLHKCEFYYGEPVTINDKSGFLVNITKEEEQKEKNIVNFRIKLKKGFYSGKINVSGIIRETYKKPGKIDIDFFINKNNKKENEKEERIVCGSQACNIY